jgi:hypothetical protein
MSAIKEIQAKFFRDEFEFSRHAVDRMLLRDISVTETREAFDSGEIIEDYPDDKYGPSCLIFGMTAKQRPLHIQCSHPTRPLLKVITVYEPDPAEWIEFRERK